MNRQESTTGTIPATAAGRAATAFGDERPSGQANAQNTAAAPDNTGAPRFSKMRTIGLEEHYIGPPFLASSAGQAMLALGRPYRSKRPAHSCRIWALDVWR